MTAWRNWLRTKRPARTPVTRARLRLERLEDRTVPAVWYVNTAVPTPAPGAGMLPAPGTSWANPFTDLQSALGAAQAGDQIWVAQGTYKPTAGTDRAASFVLKDGVALYGGFAGTETALSQRDLVHDTTVLSGDIGTAGDSSDNSYHVVTASGVGVGAVLDGFTITGGNANGGGTNQDRGGGIFADGSGVTLSDLIVTGNTAQFGGGMDDHGSNPTITNSVFANNTATALPPVVPVPGADVVVPLPSGGGLYNDGGTPTLTNVTFSGNGNGGEVNAAGGAAAITNALFWGDTGPEISGNATVSNSDVQGGATGATNLNANPLFTDAAHGNYHLLPTSPVLGAGTIAGAPTTDLDGLPRARADAQDPHHTAAVNDPGAYNYHPVTVEDLSAADGQALLTNAATIRFHVLFGTAVTDFSASDVTLGGTAGATAVQIYGTGSSYDLAVSGMAHDGSVTVFIPAGVVHDANGATNLPWIGHPPQVVYDTTPPVTTAALSGTQGSGGWYTGPVQVTLSAADAADGVASTQYQIDLGAWQTYAAPFTVTGDGTHTVAYRSTDNAGNVEQTEETTVKIDTTAPVTTATLAGTQGSAGWYTGPVQVTLAATDATSGVAATSYRIDGGAAHGYTAPFTVTGDGTHTVTFFSTDAAGNVEATETKTFKIDATAPVTTSHLTGTLHNGWYTGEVHVTLSATDATSGVAATYYVLDAGTLKPYAGPIAVRGDGTHTVTYYSFDRAGNEELAGHVTFKIDATPPTTLFQLWGTDGINGRYTSNVRVVLASFDMGSGVAATYYRVDDGALQTYHHDFIVSGLGQHHVTFYAVDNAGNAARPQAIWFRIDALPPVLGINPVAPVNQATNLHLSLAGVTVPSAAIGVTVTDALGHSVNATTTATTGGAWSLPAVDVHSLADGILTIHVTATDAAGAHTTRVAWTTKSAAVFPTFALEPNSEPAGTTLFAIVQLRDAFGNALHLAGQSVTVSLVDATTGAPVAAGALHGTLTVHTDASGRATFRDLRVSVPGRYELKAADGVMTVLTHPFRITAASTSHHG